MHLIYLQNQYDIKQLFLESTFTRRSLTCILEVYIIAIQCVFQPVAHNFELHDLLPDGHVWLCDVELHFWVVDLIGQTIAHHFWKVPNWP